MEKNKSSAPEPEGIPEGKNFEQVWNRIKTLFLALPREVLKLLKLMGNLEDSTDVEGTIVSIKDGIKIRGYNIWILVASIFIASIGLDNNSTAVIIGAMLISPLMSPILGMGLGVGINDFKTVKESIVNFRTAIIFSVTASTLYFILSPLGEMTPEIQARTAPNLFDVGIAFFGGVAGIVAQSRKEINNAIPGVAIATALMPPLCTVGFGIANLDYKVFLGASFLFLINSFFIALSTFLIVRFLNFPLSREYDSTTKSKMTNYLGISTVIIIGIAAVSLFFFVGEVRKTSQIKLFLEEKIDAGDKMKVLDWKINEKDSLEILKVTVAGERISQSEEDSLELLMSNYHLEDIDLRLKQTGIDLKNVEDKFNQIETKAKVYQADISQKTELIDSLQNVILQYASDTLPISKLKATILDVYNKSVMDLRVGNTIGLGRDSILTEIPTLGIRWQPRTPNFRKTETLEMISKELKHITGKDTAIVYMY